MKNAYTKQKTLNNLYFLIFTRISIFFSHWDCNYLLLTRNFNSHTQTKDLVVAATCATLLRKSQDYFLFSVKCWNFLYGVLQIKISVNWAAHRRDLSKSLSEWVFPIPALQSKLTLMHFFYMTSTTSIQPTLLSLTLGWKPGWTGPDFWNTELGHRGSFVLGCTGHDFSSVFYPRNCQRQLRPQQHWQNPLWAKKNPIKEYFRPYFGNF